MENGCNDQRSATGSWHQDAIGLLHPRLIANSDRPELQNTRLIMTCLNIQGAEDAEATQRKSLDLDDGFVAFNAVIREAYQHVAFSQLIGQHEIYLCKPSQVRNLPHELNSQRTNCVR